MFEKLVDVICSYVEVEKVKTKLRLKPIASYGKTVKAFPGSFRIWESRENILQ